MWWWRIKFLLKNHTHTPPTHTHSLFLHFFFSQTYAPFLSVVCRRAWTRRVRQPMLRTHIHTQNVPLCGVPFAPTQKMRPSSLSWCLNASLTTQGDRAGGGAINGAERGPADSEGLPPERRNERSSLFLCLFSFLFKREGEKDDEPSPSEHCCYFVVVVVCPPPFRLPRNQSLISPSIAKQLVITHIYI